jgi:putative SOS response-associated peptidase YedK
MCGRFTLHTDLSQIQKAFQLTRVEVEPEPSFNVAPTQLVLAVVQQDGENVLTRMRWGLVPVWAKDMSIGSRMINARAETLAEKPSFKRLLKSKRCLVVADGFYEWRKSGTQKVPMYIRLKSGDPFGFAALYDNWRTPDGDTLVSCAIITTTPNELVAPIHDRMPVIMPRKQYSFWLDQANLDASRLLPLLAPFPTREMEAYAVSRLVNAPQNNSPECIAPAAA